MKQQPNYFFKYFNPESEYASKEICKLINDYINSHESVSSEIVILCIGTDRATGDALGPLVGSYLKDADFPFRVFGTLEKPVHALNIKNVIRHIYNNYESPFVIAIDASLGPRNEIGMVTLSNGYILPGKGVNKKLPAIGNLSITGIVNLSGNSGISLLQNTRLYTVNNMALCIANALLGICPFVNLNSLSDS